MSTKVKLILLIGLMLVLSLLVVVQSMRVYHALHQVEFDIHREKRPGDAVQKWMTVAEAAKSLNISEKEVFDVLQIDPAPGDENLTFRALEDKYSKTPAEMQANLRQLRERYDPPPGNNR
jgi:NADH:ubiquinone oxidoreductase subunit D